MSLEQPAGEGPTPTSATLQGDNVSQTEVSAHGGSVDVHDGASCAPDGGASDTAPTNGDEPVAAGPHGDKEQAADGHDPQTDAADAAPDDRSPDLADESALADETKQSLSTDEVVELRQFNDKKAQIEEQYKLLASRPTPEVFTSLQPMDSSEEAARTMLAELPARKEELQSWLNEHERIEHDAVAFNVADMNRLRMVAKATAERHMSPQDTDVIELTVETLVALDRLLLLLNERRQTLDLLGARLEWDERRASCWKAYHALMRDIGVFVQKRARWTAAQYSMTADKVSPLDANDSPSMSLHSHGPKGDSQSEDLATIPGSSSAAVLNEGTSEALLSTLNDELNALSASIRLLVTELIPAAGEALDSLIDQGQVPEAYLEEQEKLENLSLDMTARGLFITSLAAQWRKANELHWATRTLHQDAKDALTEAENDRSQVPSPEIYKKMAAVSTSLNARLEDLAGATARRFVGDPMQSAHSLVFSRANHLPTPVHDAWPDQVGHNAVIATQLDRDLAAAAKRTRQVAMTVESYIRGLKAAQQAKVLQHELQKATQVLNDIRVNATEGHLSQAGPSTSTSPAVDVSSRPDLSSVGCLLPARHSLYIRRLPNDQQLARKTAAEAAKMIEELNRNLATCARHSLTHPSIRQDGTSAMDRYQEAQQAADAALAEGADLVLLLQQARTINGNMARLQSDTAQLKGDIEVASQSLAFSPLGKGWDVTSAPKPTSAEAQARLSACSQSLAELNSQLNAFKALPRSSNAEAVRQKLAADRTQVANQLAQLGALVNWYSALCQQESSVRALSQQVSALRGQAAHIKEQAASRRTSQTDLGSLRTAKAAFDEAVEVFVGKASAETTFTGDPPEDLKSLESSAPTPTDRRASREISQGSSLVSHDQEVRECVNSWCIDVRTLQEQIKSALNAAEEEAARLKPIAEATSQRSQRFDGAVSAALEAVRDLSDELNERETGFNNLMSSSGSFGDLRAYRDESREALSAKETALGSKLDALRECQREMISSLYSTGKPVLGDQDSSSTASAVKARNAAAATIKAVRRVLVSFDEQLAQTTSGRRSLSVSQSKGSISGDEPAGDISQDVFGPRQSTVAASNGTTSVPPSLDYDAFILKLRHDQLDAQTVEDGMPQLEALLDLPDAAHDRHIQDWWRTTRSALDEPLGHVKQSPSQLRLKDAVQQRERSVVRHHQLTTFRAAAADVEQIVSSLLNALDFSGGRSTTSSVENLSGRSSRATSPYLATLDQVETLQQRLVAAVDMLNKAAEPIISDARVSRRLGQLTRATKDVLADARDFGHTTDVSAIDALDDAESVVSSASSIPSSLPSVEEEEQSLPAVTLPRSSGGVSPLPVIKEQKSTPGPGPRPSALAANGLPSTPISSTPRRVVSGQTPSSVKVPTRLRRFKSNIGAPQTPGINTPRVTAPSPRVGPSKLPVRTPSSEARRKVSESTPARYRANPKSKLDIAVGKIVNHLPVPVKISHASTGPNARKQESWKDESGRYWIGDPEPKLCFCRILRSRTVMVRVGGGWQELSSYIMQHYSHLAAASISFPTSPTATRGTSSTSPKAVRLNTTGLPWISSATMTRSSTLEVPPVVLTPADEQPSYPFGSESSSGGGRTSRALTPSRSSTPSLAISPAASPGLSPSASTPVMLGHLEDLPPQRHVQARTGGKRQSLDLNTLGQRWPSTHAAAVARRTPSPTTLETGPYGTIRASPGRSPLHFRTASLGLNSTPARPLSMADSSSPNGMLPFFIRKENAVPPFRSVSGNSQR